MNQQGKSEMIRNCLIVILLLSFVTLKLEAQPDPQGSLTANGPICISPGTGGLLTWTATAGTGPYTIVYKENGGDDRTETGVASGGSFTPYTSPITGTTTYTLVSVTDEATLKTRSNGFTQDEATITVDPLPDASVSGSQTICANGTATVGAGEASASNGTILWTENGAGSIISGATTLTPTYQAAAGDGGNTVTLTMTVTSDNSCGTATASDTYTINVDPLPVANVTGSQTICENGTATVGAGEASASYGTILWTENGAGSIISGATTLTPTYQAATADGGNTVTLTMTVTSNNPLCGAATASDTYTIHVDHLPVANVTGSQTICEDGTATVGAGEASASYGSILWTENGAGSIISGGTTLTPTYQAAAGDAGNTVTLTMTVTSNNTCGTATASDTYTVNVNPSQTLANASQVAQVCSGNPANIKLEGMLSGTTFTVHYSIGGVVRTPVSGITADGTGTAYFYTDGLASENNGKILTITGITTTNPAPSCYKSFSAGFTLIVNSASTPSLTGNFSPCVNSTGNVYTTDAGMTNYTWTVSPGGSLTSGGGTTDNTVTITWNSAGSQSVSVNYINASGCASASPTVKNVDVKPLPAPTISGIVPVCLNSGGHIYTTQADMTAYAWNVSAGNTITSGGTGDMIIVTWNNATSASVSINYTDNNGCRALSPVTVPVTVNLLPVPSLNGPTPVCEGSTGNSYSTDGGMSDYFWTISEGGTITAGGGFADNTVTVTWNTAGSRKVSVNYTDPATGCTASSATEFPVTVNSLPVPTITGPATPNVNTSGNTYTTEAAMTGYNWAVSAGGTIVSGAGTNSISVTWNGSGAQTVSVNYLNPNNCTATSPATYNVTVNSLPVVSGITIHGDARSGLTLNATYTYSDANGDPEGASVYQWYTGTSSGGAGSVPIASATGTAYKLTDSELTKYIGFSVTPAALSGSTPGNMATSIAWAGPVINDPPEAAIQSITGSLDVNGLLTGHYVYSDLEGDIESGTLYQWYSSGTAGGTYTPVPGETNIAHVITNDEQGRYFKIYITPEAASGTTTGTQVVSNAYGPANSQPVAANVNIISGIAAVGSTLEGDYDFSDVDPADIEGTSTFRWLRNGTIPITGATTSAYLVTFEDEGYKLSFEVTPVSQTGYPNTGTPVQSAMTNFVVDTSSLKPVASQVCIEGIRTAGQILRGKYYYDFYRSEGTSTYQWYRNGIPITGATGILYTLQQVEDIDSNADISFEVTPRSSNIPEKVGTPVASNPLARIIMPKDQYSVSESDVTLSANVPGGVFSGTGVTGNIFSPKTAGSDGSPYTLSYLLNVVNTEHNCSQQASKPVYVYPNVSSFVGFDTLYCHDNGPDVVNVIGVPEGSSIIGFTCTNMDGIVSQSGTTVTIDPGRMRPGIDHDILFFSYNYLGSFYQISRSFRIDSVGTEIKIINLDSSYCQGDPKEYISIEGIYPVGGSAVWTGDIMADARTGSAYADPSLGTAGVSYPISYRYRSPRGCYSEILRDTVTINPLPDASFALNATYNIYGGPVDLVPEKPGGVFSGKGVSEDKLFPDIAGLGEYEIKYSITDANGCSSELGKKTTIRQAQGTFTDIPSVICYSDTTYNVKITGLPAGVTVTGFTNTKNTLEFTMGMTNADYYVPAAGEGNDTLYFSYLWDGVDYEISKPLNVDSLGYATIELTPGQKICDNDGFIKLYESPTGGIFTGPVVGGYLDPTIELGPVDVTYTFTNIKTGCSIRTSIPVIIYPSAKVAFEPEDYCIQDDNDITSFINNTTSSDSVKTWLWEFSDVGGTSFSEDETAGYLYTSGGLQKISLTATTINGCVSVKESTFNFGKRPEADFYWKNDCMHPGDDIILRDSTTSFTPIESRSWRLFDGPEFSTADKVATYPKSDTGYLKIQYIVRTTIENCIDTVTKNIYIRPSIIVPADGYYEDLAAGNGGWIKGQTSGSSWLFGQPDWSGISITPSGGNSWFTHFNPEDKDPESSSILSPCFDFTVTERPLIKLSMMKRFTRDMDGASLQYRIGDNDNWQIVGSLDDGIEWYNSAVIRGAPGGNQMGWTTRGEPDDTLVESIHTLDELTGQSDVVFRIAYGSDGTLREYQGIVLDDIWIGERSRKILIEHFTNIDDPTGTSKISNSLVNTIVRNRSEDVINIQYHTNFPGSDQYYDENPADVGARILFYGLSQAPYTFVDGGTQHDFAYMYSYANLSLQIDSNDVAKRSLIPSMFDIFLEADTEKIDKSKILKIHGRITALEEKDYDNITLFIAITEKKSTRYTGLSGETEFRNVFRKFLPDAGGILLKNNWGKLDSVTIPEQSWTIDLREDTADIEVIAFIQNTITKEVYQAASVVLQHDITVGMEDVTDISGTGFTLYPNPAVNKLTVDFKEPIVREADIRIYDILGVMISSYRAGPGTTEFLINDLNLKQGIYLVRITSGAISIGEKKLIISGN